MANSVNNVIKLPTRTPSTRSYIYVVSHPTASGYGTQTSIVANRTQCQNLMKKLRGQNKNVDIVVSKIPLWEYVTFGNIAPSDV